MSDELEVQKGYLPVAFTICPLPYKKQGKEFIREYGKYRAVMYSSRGVPYGKMGRSVLSLITTTAILQKHGHIELGNITDTLRKLDMECRGGARGTASRVTETFRQFGSLFVSNESDISTGTLGGIRIENLAFSDHMELYWNQKTKDDNLPTLFENFIDLSPRCLEVMQRHSFPIDILKYNSIQSPRGQDVYGWIVRRLYGINEKTFISWDSLYGQFADSIDRRKKPEFRKEFVEHMLLVKEIFPEAQLQADEKGITLSPSQSHIAPKNVGYL
jgi:hypothetical protein